MAPSHTASAQRSVAGSDLLTICNMSCDFCTFPQVVWLGEAAFVAQAPMGPLDKWLHRPPLEPVQPTSSSGDQRGDQQTAEPPASSAEQQKAPAGTLRAFLVKLDAGTASRESDGIEEAPARARRRAHGARCAGGDKGGGRLRLPETARSSHSTTVCSLTCSCLRWRRSVLDWRLTGSMHSSAAALLHHRHAAAFRQLAILESHAWQRPVLGGTPLSPEEAGSIQAAAFDSQGELLVAGSEEGLLTVHSTAQLLAAAAAGGTLAAPVPPGQQAVGTADPLLVLDTHLPKLQAVGWNPADENVVGVVSSATRQLHLYDLQHTQVGGGCGGHAAAALAPLLSDCGSCTPVLH